MTVGSSPSRKYHQLWPLECYTIYIHIFLSRIFFCLFLRLFSNDNIYIYHVYCRQYIRSFLESAVFGMKKEIPPHFGGPSSDVVDVGYEEAKRFSFLWPPSEAGAVGVGW